MFTMHPFALIAASFIAVATLSRPVTAADGETGTVSGTDVPNTWVASSLDDQLVVTVLDRTHVEICSPQAGDHAPGRQTVGRNGSITWIFSALELSGREKNDTLVMEVKDATDHRKVVFSRVDQVTVDEVLSRLQVIRTGLLQAIALHRAPPWPLVRQRPAYPPEMKDAGIEGTVTVQFELNKIGLVVDAKVEKSTRAEFEPAALAAVRQWIFRPGIRDGTFVSTHLTQDLVFHIDPAEKAPPVATK